MIVQLHRSIVYSTSQYLSIYITHFSVSPHQGSLLLLTVPVWVEANPIRIQRVQPSIHSVLALLGSLSTTFTLATGTVCVSLCHVVCKVAQVSDNKTLFTNN